MHWAWTGQSSCDAGDEGQFRASIRRPMVEYRPWALRDPESRHGRMQGAAIDLESI